MNIFRNLSIKNKIIFMVLIVTVFTIGFGFALIIVKDIKSFKSDMFNTVQMNANLIGEYSVTPLAFQDEKGAKEVLKKLQSIPSIENGYVYGETGELFAAYNKSTEAVDGHERLPDQLEDRFQGNYLHIYHPIYYDNVRYGTIYLRASTAKLNEKIENYLFTMFLIMLGLFIISYLLAHSLQQFISRPILRLASVAERISDEADYSIRVEREGEDEIGVLYDQFNNMLEQIHIREKERDGALQALKESERKWKLLYENLPGASFAVNKNFVIEDVNDVFCDITGYTRMELIGQHCDIVCPDAYHQKCPLHHVEKEKMNNEETIIKTKDGSNVPVIKSARKIPMGDQMVIIENFQDITERKRAEEQIQRSEERLRMILRTAKEGFLQVDGKETITDVNPEMCSILGRPESVVVGQNIFDFVDSKNAEVFWQQIRIRNQGVRSSYEITLKKPDFTNVHCLFNASPILDEGGKKVGSFAMVTDITDRKRAEQELLTTRNYLKNVFNSMPSMLISVNPEGTITQWNTAAEKYTGIPAMEAISKKVWDVVPFLKKYERNFRHVISNQLQEEFLKQQVMGNEKKYLNISMYPLIFNGTNGAVIRVDDVTELEKKDAQLRQAQKMETVGNLAGGLAHDFNNVLGGIMGTVSLLKYLLGDDEIDLEEFASNIEIIEEATDRAADMVQQLLTLSRRHDLTFAPVDLNLTVKHVIKICKNTFDKSIDIRVNYQEKSAMVNADPAQMEQVLLNLCVNASHAMTIMRDDDELKGGILTVSIDKIEADRHFCATHPEAIEGEYWILLVSDTGVGMDTKTVSKIFDPFFTTKEKSKGTGLGLAMVYNIIQQHKGFIDVYSDVGVGTSINVFLPVLEHGEEISIQKKAREEIPRGEGLILVVDDEAIMRKTAKKILSECGYDIILAENGQDAVNVYKENYRKIDLILLDMAMPIKSGKEAYMEMRKINPDLRVLMASGFKQDKRVQDALEMGVNGFIKKPYAMKDLAKAIKNVLS